MDVQSLFFALRTNRYSFRSATALFVYDYSIAVLTFPAEVQHFWRRGWSFITVLFLFVDVNLLGVEKAHLSRNHSVDSATLPEVHLVAFYRTSVANRALISVVNSDLILLVRIYAAYERNLRVLFLTSGLIATSTLTSLLINIIGVPKALSRASLGISGCAANLPSFFFAVWIPLLIVETVLFFLMGYRAFKVFKTGTNSPLLRLLIRDSATYFLTIGSVVLTNCLIWAAAPLEWAPFALSWEIVLPCILGDRLLLNIRERSLKEPLEVSGNDSIVFINPRHGTDETSMPTAHSFSLNTLHDPLKKGDTVL
ncbi:hypothetical protein K439DRAFT_1550482 [Ramaria rubella]|nr:hypothetical protein K439DRAFT_1550482 [Ramaria rubella]